MASTWAKIAETSGARIYGLATGVISLFLTARMLGPDGRGVVAVILVWVNLFATFSGLSLGQVAQNVIQCRRKEDWLPNILGFLAPSTLILTLIAYVVGFSLFHWFGDQLLKGIPPSLIMLAFLMLPLLIWEEYSTSMMFSAGCMRAYNIVQFFARTLALVSVYIFIEFLNLGVAGVVLAQLSGQFIVSASAFFILWRAAGKKMRFDRKDAFAILKGARFLHFNTIGSFILASSTILILNNYVSKAEVGNYQLAYQMLSILFIIPQAASMVLFSEMTSVGPDKMWPVQKRIMFQTASLMFIVGILSYFFARPAIYIFAGHKFEQAISVFQLLLPNLIGLTLAQLMGCQWIGRGLFIMNAGITFTFSLLTVAANLLLIPRYGVHGAIWANWANYLALVVLGQIIFIAWCEAKWRNSEHLTEVESVPRAAA
jgi:antigen flippase